MSPLANARTEAVKVLIWSRLPQQNSRPILNDCISEILSPISNRYNKKVLLEDKNDITKLFDSLKSCNINSKDYLANITDILLDVSQCQHTGNNVLTFVNVDQFFAIAFALYDLNLVFLRNAANSTLTVLMEVLKSKNLYDGSTLFLFDKYIPFEYVVEIEAVKFGRIMNIDFSNLRREWECQIRCYKTRFSKWRIRSHGSVNNLFQLKITSNNSLMRATDAKDRPLFGHVAIESVGLSPYTIFATPTTRKFGNEMMSQFKIVYIKEEKGLRTRYRKGEGNWYEYDQEYEFSAKDFHYERFLYQTSHDLFDGEELEKQTLKTSLGEHEIPLTKDMLKIEYSFANLHMSCALKCNHVNYLALKHDGLSVKVRFLDHIIEILSPLKNIKLDIPSIHYERWCNVIANHFRHITFLGELVSYHNQDYVIIFGARLYHSPFSITVNLLDALFSRLYTFSFFEQINIYQQKTVKIAPSISIAEAGKIFQDLYKFWQEKIKSKCIDNDGLIGNNLFESCSIKFKTRHSIDLSYNSFSKLFNASGLNLFHYAIFPLIGDFSIFEFEIFEKDGKDYCEIIKVRNDLKSGNTISAIYLILRAYLFYKENNLKKLFSVN